MLGTLRPVLHPSLPLLSPGLGAGLRADPPRDAARFPGGEWRRRGRAQLWARGALCGDTGMAIAGVRGGH